MGRVSPSAAGPWAHPCCPALSSCPCPSHLQEPLRRREAARAQPEQDPAPGQAACFVVLGELLADLAVNFVPERHRALGGQAGAGSGGGEEPYILYVKSS